mmetsp:Transcript_25993/g.42486  ORF Transcript_25993/g.42486 Transcript_25993/m.42486 type:complete len:361 (-) Transcript_25993:253-1335(-)|eukprot:CAMPEP_0202708746 /NCGR_PEP_ID=MMETSP1385-20130828/20908_1 /ASSEMBLY_ACC=CAM_ASM_000861 /TAXON_ID=933848 /ORGANISM="Elphidium margaritaceum" /LENGTH=360 /DNA_ID=CAMNT_0049367811 /DNA_START=921 /DNA_END=2003 /DNA_ORIENTATION=+
MSLAKADQFMAQADKKANKFDWFGTAKQQNQEDAAELYGKAAAQYKIAKDYGKAGTCYTNAAQCNMAAENEIEAKQAWREAGKCWRHVDFKRAIECYKNAIQLNLDADRFGQAAKLQEEVGDMLAEDEHLKEAIEAYEQSADYFEAENDTGNKNKRLLKVAHMCGKAGDYEKAIKIFENTAKASVDNNLLRWKVKEYLFKAILCHLCLKADDEIVRKKSVKWPEAGTAVQERYCDISDIYASSRESKLATQLIECLPNNDIQAFKDAVASYDKICTLEKWNFELVYNLQKYMNDRLYAAPDLNDFGDDEEQKQNNANENANDAQNSNTGNAAADATKQSNPFQAPSAADIPADIDHEDLL